MRNDLLFSIGKKKDLNKIFEVFTHAIDNMIANDIYQWDAVYPSIKDVEMDLEKKQLYIGSIDDDIAVVYVLNDESDEQYCNGKWSTPDENYMVIHRICVNPKFQNRGVGKDTMEHIEEELRERGIAAIRLDTFSQNPFSLKMYNSLGYKIVGKTNWRKGLFYLMEKLIIL